MIIANVVGIALVITVMIILTWVIIFGGVGVAIANSKGGSAVLGFALGAILGPLGWLVIWLVSRKSSGGDLADLLDPGSGGAELPAGESDSIFEEDDW